MRATIPAEQAERLVDLIRAAKAARLAAEAAEERAIRDAVTEGLSPSRAATALGTTNRQRVYAILDRSPGDDTPQPPALPVVAYLRGAGVKQPAWDRIADALHARGIITVRDRTQAWHLARGGAPVVLCDFSAGQLDDHPVRVGRVRARYDVTRPWSAVEDLATGDHAAHLIRTRSPLVGQRIEVEHKEMELQLISGGPIGRPQRDLGEGRTGLDEQAIARAVAAA